MKLFSIAALLLVVACDSADDRPANVETKPFEELTDSLDEAEAVERQLQEQKERMDRALREAEQRPQS